MRTVRLDFLRQTYHRNVLEALLEDHKHAIRGKILDIGSRSRRYDWLFDGMVTAVDVRPNEDLNIEYADVEQSLPFPDNHFDSVLCLEVFEYLEHFRRAIDEIHRVLRPEGAAIVTVPFMDNAMHKDSPPHYDKLRFTKECLLDIFGEKFSVEYQAIGNGFTVIWDILRKKILTIRPRLMADIILRLALPYLSLIRFLRLDRVVDDFYSGSFIVLKK